MPRPEVIVAPCAGCAGLGAVVATWWGAATGEEDEHAARTRPATRRAGAMPIARWRAELRPRNLVERCCLAMCTLVPPPVQRETLKTVKNRYALSGSRAQARRQLRASTPAIHSWRLQSRFPHPRQCRMLQPCPADVSAIRYRGMPGRQPGSHTALAPRQAPVLPPGRTFLDWKIAGGPRRRDLPNPGGAHRPGARPSWDLARLRIIPEMSAKCSRWSSRSCISSSRSCTSARRHPAAGRGVSSERPAWVPALDAVSGVRRRRVRRANNLGSHHQSEGVPQ